MSLYYENKDPTVPLVDNKEFRSIKNMIIKAVMELPPEVEIAHSAVSKKDIEDAPIQLRPWFYEEEAEMSLPVSSIPPKIVTHHVEAVAPHMMAAAKGIISALARLIGDKCQAHQQSLQGQIDHRLKQQINQKKLAIGLKIESTQKASYQTEEEYEMSR